MSDYKPRIGLEVHAKITATKCKLFSKGANNDIEDPNSQLQILDFGTPGAIQVLNPDAVRYAVRACVALNMKINEHFYFDRKHYFYPDLPCGYQITQYHKPIGMQGSLPIYSPGSNRRINIRQLHMETDAVKSLHQNDYTLLDFNRAGSPLMEIVTEPDMYSAEEAVLFVKMLRLTLKHIGVCDGNMELGNMRVDVSISVSKNNNLGTRVEVKNLNSCRSIKRAIEEETRRQIELIKSGGKVEQESRLFNDREGVTTRMRTKEDPRGYMYFKDPDLPNFMLNQKMVVQERSEIQFTPESLFESWSKFVPNINNLIGVIEEPNIVRFMLNALENTSEMEKLQMFKLMLNEVFAKINQSGELPINPAHFRSLTRLIIEKDLSSLVIKEILDEIWTSPEDPDHILNKRKLNVRVNTDEIKAILVKVCMENQNEVARYKNGETKLQGFFIGQAMKYLGNKCNPKNVRDLLDEVIK